jgi:hypothetical protein
MVNGVNDLKVQLRNRSRGETFNDAMSFRMSQKHREKLSALSVKYDADMGSVIRALISLFNDDEFDADVRGVVVSNSGTIEHPLNLKVDLLDKKIESLLSSVVNLGTAGSLGPAQFPSGNFPSSPPYEVLLEMAQMTKGEGGCPLGAFLVNANDWLPKHVPARFLYRNHFWFGLNEVLHFIGVVYPNGSSAAGVSFPEYPSKTEWYDDAKGHYSSDFAAGWNKDWTGWYWYGNWYCISRMKNEGSLERFVRSVQFDLYAAASSLGGNGESLRKGLAWKSIGSQPDHWFGNLSFVGTDGQPIEIESTYIV